MMYAAIEIKVDFRPPGVGLVVPLAHGEPQFLTKDGRQQPDRHQSAEDGETPPRERFFVLLTMRARLAAGEE